jgi:hypothetical protein
VGYAFVNSDTLEIINHGTKVLDHKIEHLSGRMEELRIFVISQAMFVDSIIIEDVPGMIMTKRSAKEGASYGGLRTYKTLCYYLSAAILGVNAVGKTPIIQTPKRTRTLFGITGACNKDQFHRILKKKYPSLSCCKTDHEIDAFALAASHSTALSL